MPLLIVAFLFASFPVMAQVARVKENIKQVDVSKSVQTVVKPVKKVVKK